MDGLFPFTLIGCWKIHIYTHYNSTLPFGSHLLYNFPHDFFSFQTPRGYEQDEVPTSPPVSDGEVSEAHFPWIDDSDEEQYSNENLDGVIDASP